MGTTKTIYQLHEDHNLWLNKLAFYKDELAVMQKHLSAAAEKNTKKEMFALVEHFQNQLIVQDEQVDTLLHLVKEHESSLEKAANKRPVAIDRQPFEDHVAQREAMESFEKIFNDLRKEMAAFLSKLR
jgi:hypothetical protein